MKKHLTLAENNRLKVIKEISREFLKYKKHLLRHGKKYVFEAYGKTRFYTIVKSYFIDCGTVPDEITNRLAGRSCVIDDLWETLHRYGGLVINTWEDVERLTFRYLESNIVPVHY